MFRFRFVARTDRTGEEGDTVAQGKPHMKRLLGCRLLFRGVY
jgi:hypothetical protein